MLGQIQTTNLLHKKIGMKWLMEESIARFLTNSPSNSVAPRKLRIVTCTTAASASIPTSAIQEFVIRRPNNALVDRRASLVQVTQNVITVSRVDPPRFGPSKLFVSLWLMQDPTVRVNTIVSQEISVGNLTRATIICVQRSIRRQIELNSSGTLKDSQK